MNGYIYKITNSINGMFYIGSTINIKKRWNRHLNSLRKHYHHNIFLNRAFKKYGEKSFILTYKEVHVDDEKALRKLEERYINFCWRSGKLYNVSKQGSGGDLISYHPLNESIRLKQKEKALEQWKNKSSEEKKEYSIKMSGEKNPNYNKRWTNEQKENLSKKLKNYYQNNVSKTKNKNLDEIVGEEKANIIRLKLSNSAKKKIGDKNPFYGKHHNEETKEKIRKANKGRKPSNRKKVLYKGVIYDSANDCAKAIHAKLVTVAYRCRENIFGFSYYDETQLNSQREAKIGKYNYNKEYIINELKKYSTQKELKENDAKLYYFLRKHKEFTYLLKENLNELRHKWNLTEIIEIAKKYKTYKDFRKNETRAYSVMVNRKWINFIKKYFKNNLN